MNTANGAFALNLNTGSQNTATGAQALFNNSSGQFNTAAGALALFSNTNGVVNTANGYQALYSNTGGNRNTAIGFQALSSNTEGDSNTAIGLGAGSNQTTGSGNVYIGTAEVSGVPAENNAFYIASIFGQTSPSGVPVVINSNSKLGTATSSKRFKENIKPMDKASEALFSLKPVTFRYKKGIDLQMIPQFGLVAEDVEKVNPDLVVRDKDGKPYTVRYDAVNAMLLNEFLKEHRTVQELKSIVAKQEANAMQQRQQIKALTVGLQKVSAQLEMTRPAPQVVVDK
jgi:trimeric autotransporter adhesin